MHECKISSTCHFFVDTFIALFPANVGLTRLQVRPDEAKLVNVDIDRKKTLLCSVEPFNSIEAGCFREFAVQSIAPTVILATEDTGCTTLRLYYRECSVSTNVVEAVDLAFTVFDQEE
jgi:hypothetical protein